jgi:CelD/BcsL family acetyltransferase involved in cellulose biosynthesis
MTMHVTVVRPDELGPGEEKLWREFQNSYPMGAHANYSLTYVRAACRADGNGRVAVAEDGGVIRAFLPYTKGSDGMATVLGGGQTGVDGVISSNDPVDLRRVVRRAGLRGWRFSHAPAGQTAVDPYRYEGGYHSQEVRFADLRGGYDAYRQALPKSVTKRIARTAGYRRALERELGEVSFEWNSGDPANRDLLLKWKAAQFEYVRQWLSSPSSRPMVEELATSDNEDCTGITSVLYAGTKPVSIVLSLRSGHILIPWILTYDSEYSRFSPGTIEWLALFEEAAARGVQILDFGYGDDRYKQRFGNGSYMVGGGAVWARRLESAARSVYRRTRFRD